MQKEMYSGSKAYMEPVRFRRLYLRIMAEVVVVKVMQVQNTHNCNFKTVMSLYFNEQQ